jgi:hypothetical protein
LVANNNEVNLQRARCSILDEAGASSGLAIRDGVGQARPWPRAAEIGSKFGHRSGVTPRKPLLRDRSLRVADSPDGQNLFDFSDDRF